MAETGAAGPGPGAEGDDQYDPAGLAVLEGLGPSRRPWQVMLTWTGADPPGPGLSEALGRILDLFPDVGRLTVHTAGGGIVATRDVHGNYPAEVDAILARLFRDNPGVVGVTFPARMGQAAHTATPDDPHWSPLGKASAAITAASEAGTITPEEAIERLKQLYGTKGSGADPGPGAANVEAGDPSGPEA